MLKRFLIILMLGILLHTAAGARHYFNKRETLHSASAVLSAAIESNGRYYTSGYCIDSINYIGPGNVFLGVIGIRFTVRDGNGKILYDNLYQRPDKRATLVANKSLRRLSDETFLVPGDTGDTSGHAKLMLACFDSTAKIKWVREYDKPYCTVIQLDGDYWSLNDFQPDGYGNWLMLSTYQCGVKFQWSYTSMLLTKLDSSFNVIWHKKYGNEIQSSRAAKLIAEPTGYTIAGGFSNNLEVIRDFDYRAELFRTDTAGNTTWHWLSDGNKLITSVRDCIRTKDGGYIYCGQGDAYEELDASGQFGYMHARSWIEKIDSTGKLLWNSTLKNNLYNGGNYNAQNVLKELTDGDVMVGGQVMGKFLASDTEATRNYGSLTRLAADGTIKWHRRYVANDDSLIHFLYDMKQTEDGGFVLAGEARDDYWPYENPIQRAWLLKVDSNGCASADDPQCRPGGVGVGTQQQQEGVCKAYPNPVDGVLNISYGSNLAGASLSLTDITGRVVAAMVLQDSQGKATVDMSNLPPGIYLYRITRQGMALTSGKVVKQ